MPSSRSIRMGMGLGLARLLTRPASRDVRSKAEQLLNLVVANEFSVQQMGHVI